VFKHIHNIRIHALIIIFNIYGSMRKICENMHWFLTGLLVFGTSLVTGLLVFSFLKAASDFFKSVGYFISLYV